MIGNEQNYIDDLNHQTFLKPDAYLTSAAGRSPLYSFHHAKLTSHVFAIPNRLKLK